MLAAKKCCFNMYGWDWKLFWAIKYVIADHFIPNENPVIIDEGDPVDSFSFIEVEKSLTLCSNGKSLGIDGVTYEDIKGNWGDTVMILSDYLTLYWWKENFLIHGNMLMQSKEKLWLNRHINTERYIIIVNYKIFSHCLCNQIIPFISNEIAFWQRAHLEKWDR